MNKRKNVLNVPDIPEESLADVLDQTPLCVVDITVELDYYTNPDPTPADHIEFLQSIVNNSRILGCTEETQVTANNYFKKGWLFRHQPRAIKDNATRYSRLEEKEREEALKNGECDCPNCKGE